MSDQDNLRGRIAESQRRVLKRRALIADVDLPAYLAQAIIDELGLTVEERLTEFGIDDPGYQERVVGKWEESDEQEPRP